MVPFKQPNGAPLIPPAAVPIIAAVASSLVAVAFALPESTPYVELNSADSC